MEEPEWNNRHVQSNQCFVSLRFIGKEVGETVMYFGCRHKNEDFIYQEELEEAEKNKVLTQLNVAFSRDQEHKVHLLYLTSVSVSYS